MMGNVQKVTHPLYPPINITQRQINQTPLATYVWIGKLGRHLFNLWFFASSANIILGNDNVS